MQYIAMTKTQRLPKGEKFMPNVSIKQLKKAIKKEKNVGAYNRLWAALQRKEGKTLHEIEDILDKSIRTIGRWLHRMHDMGLAGRYHNKHPGGRMQAETRTADTAKERSGRWTDQVWF